MAYKIKTNQGEMVVMGEPKKPMLENEIITMSNVGEILKRRREEEEARARATAEEVKK
jgi:hypothetical protein